MFTSKEFIGISLDGDLLRVAHVEVVKKQVHVKSLRKLKLITPIEKPEDEPELTSDDVFDDVEDDADLVFGLDDDEEETGTGLDEIDLGEIDEGFEDDDDLDLAAEAAAPSSNEMLLYDYLSTFEKQKVVLGLNVPAGDSIYQLLKDADFSDMKKKQLQEYIHEKLQAIYGGIPNPDLYDYHIRDDDTLVLASSDAESRMLQLVNSTAEEFNEKYFIRDTVADESVMIGLYKQHYVSDDESITGLLQVGKDKCRLVFMSGGKILQISPVINEGADQKNFLNTIFSKILFQLDTGEVPGLDRLIVFNNTKGDKLLDFFRSSFTDIVIEDFTFNDEKVQFNEELEESISAYTTTVGVACVAADSELTDFINLSFLPKYVEDQQKIFKLQWHGVILLILIGISPVILNHFYQQYAAEIDSLQLQYDRTEAQSLALDPAVDEVNMLTEQLELMQEQLGLLTELSEDNIRWTVTIDEFNRAASRVNGLWINSFRQNNDVIMVDGYSLQRDRIPELAEEFSAVTLLNVRKQEIRERDVYLFTMMIREVIDDESRFTPGAASDFQQMLNQ